MRNQVLIIDDGLNVCKEIKYNLQNELTDVEYVQIDTLNRQSFSPALSKVYV